MKTPAFCCRKKWSKILFVPALILFVSAGLNIPASATKIDETPQKKLSEITTGSGNIYQTIVERRTEGRLSDADLDQASLLTSHVVKHLNTAVENLLDGNTGGAGTDIENAQKLIKLVRNLLPVTTVTTIVKDNSGKEVYRETDKIQEDQIPLYQGMIAMEVMEPIMAAKKKEADLKGLRLDNTEIINTAVLANLNYIERKINRAAALLDNPEEALGQLLLAQSHGIAFQANPTDAPLVQVQQALRLAERMVAEGNQEAARDNLEIARVKLEVYRELLGQADSKQVKQLEDDIANLMNKTGEKDTAAKIRGFWERTVNLFKKEPGQAHVTNKPAKG
jgi:hypothetical protein